MGQTLHDGGIFLIRCGVWNGCLQSYALAGMPIDDCENNERYANSYGGNVVLEISNTGIAKATYSKGATDSAGSTGSEGSEGSKGLVRRKKIMKRRRV